MKKLILILLAAVAFSCGDSNRSSQNADDNNTDNTETVEPDTTGMESETQGTESDTTYRQQQSDTTRNR